MTTSNVLLLIVLWYEKNFFSVVSFLLHTKYLLPVFGLLSSLLRCTTLTAAADNLDIFVRILMRLVYIETISLTHFFFLSLSIAIEMNAHTKCR